MHHNENAPCKGCEERAVGCHASCKYYIKWAAKHKKEKEALKNATNCVIRPSDFVGTSPPPGYRRRALDRRT